MGETVAKGYGYRHQVLRRQWATRVATGTVACWRCGVRIGAQESWHLGHADGNKFVHKGPEHVLCNVRTNAADRKGDPKPRVDRFWQDAPPAFSPADDHGT